MKLNFKISHWQILTLALVLFLSIQPTQSPADCTSEVQPVTVRGNSLGGVVEDGENLKIFVGYYQCHPVERGDIVAYKYAGRDAPIIKIVKAIPKDKWHLEKDKNRDSYQIMVNEQPALVFDFGHRDSACLSSYFYN